MMKMRIFTVLLAIAAFSSLQLSTPAPQASETLQGGETLTPGDSVGAANFAWSLFVEAMRPANGSPSFQSWTEQTCLINPGSCPPAATGESVQKLHHLHGSPLLRKNVGAKTAAPLSAVQCGAGSPMNTNSGFHGVYSN